MQTSSIDLLQFHWWDYSDDRYLTALDHLHSLHKEGILRNPPALTNFNTKVLARIVDHGIPITSNQVSFSILDRRPLQKGMVEFCKKHDINLVCYGVLLGGFMSEKWLSVSLLTQEHLTTTSLRKYARFIMEAGGWAVFLGLLEFLKGVGDRIKATISQVAMAWVLAQPQVSGVLIGQRLGVSNHIAENQDVADRVVGLLTPALCKEIEDYCEKNLSPMNGDCGDEYRG